MRRIINFLSLKIYKIDSNFITATQETSLLVSPQPKLVLRLIRGIDYLLMINDLHTHIIIILLFTYYFYKHV